MCASVPQSEVALTRTTTSRGPGLGSGRLVNVNPGSGAVLTRAFMPPLYISGLKGPTMSKKNGCTTFGPKVGCAHAGVRSPRSLERSRSLEQPLLGLPHRRLSLGRDSCLGTDPKTIGPLRA